MHHMSLVRHNKAATALLAALVMGAPSAFAQQSVDVRTDEARQFSEDFDRLTDVTARANFLLRTDDGGDISNIRKLLFIVLLT